MRHVDWVMCNAVSVIVEGASFVANLLMHGPCILTCSTMLMGLPFGFWMFATAGWLSVLLACAIVFVLYLWINV